VSSLGFKLPTATLSGGLSYKSLYSGGGSYIVSSVVPAAKVGDPIVQSMIDEVSAILRGVDNRYFPRITYVTAEKRGEQYLLYYAAEGMGFRVGVVCGTDGIVHRVLLEANSGKFRSNVHDISDPDDLRQWVDIVGMELSNARGR